MTLEMTEGYLIQNPERARQSIDRLKASGLKSHSMISVPALRAIGYLRQFGFDRMKIDRSLVLALDESSRAARHAAGDGGARPVPRYSGDRRGHRDGKSRRCILHLCGCDELQGYLFGKPMPAEAINAIFAGTNEAGTDGRCGGLSAGPDAQLPIWRWPRFFARAI